VTNATAQSLSATTVRGIRWGRVVGGGILVEAALMVLAVPLLFVMDNPLVAGAAGGGASNDFTIFFVSVASACFVAGALVGWWVARPLSSARVLHGALTGIIATAIYLAICSVPPNTIAAVIAAYGPFWFFLANGLRIVGSMVGAAYQGRGR
jgi:hypothetical protein